MLWRGLCSELGDCPHQRPPRPVLGSPVERGGGLRVYEGHLLHEQRGFIQLLLRKTRLNTHEGGSGVNPPPPRTPPPTTRADRISLNWLGFLLASLAPHRQHSSGESAALGARLFHRCHADRRLRSPGGGWFNLLPQALAGRRPRGLPRQQRPGHYLCSTVFQLLIVVNAAAAGDLRVEGNKKTPGPQRQLCRLYIQVSRCSKKKQGLLQEGGGGLVPL